MLYSTIVRHNTRFSDVSLNIVDYAQYLSDHAPWSAYCALYAVRILVPIGSESFANLFVDRNF